MHAIGTEHDEQYEAQKYDNCRTNYAYKSRQKRLNNNMKQQSVLALQSQPA